MEYKKMMEDALAEYEREHGKQPKAIMLGDDVWRVRADAIAADMNRTGKNSEVVVHRLPEGCNGIVCA